MSAPKCAKCRGLLPPWLTATADAGNARCPNCGHINDLTGAKTPGPVELASSRQTPVVSTAAVPSRTPAPVKPAQARPAATIVGHAIQDPGRLRPAAQAAPRGAQAQAAPAQAQAAPAQAQAAPAQGQAARTAPQRPFAATVIMHAPAKVAPREEPPPAAAKKKTLTEIAAFVPPAPAAAAFTPTPAVLPPAATEPVGGDLTEIVPDFSVEIENDAPPAVESQKPSSSGLPAWSAANNVMADADEALAAQDVARKRAKIAKISVAAVGLVGGFLFVAIGLPRSHAPKPPESAPQEAPRPIAHEPAKPVEAKPVEAKPVVAKPVVAKPVEAKAAPRPEPKVAEAKPEIARPRAPEPKPAVVAAAEPPPAPRASAPAEVPAARRSSGPSEADLKRAHDAYMDGNSKLFKGQTNEAIAAFKESVRLDSRNAAAHRGLGLAYVQAGNAASALRELKKYVRAAPTAPDRALIEKRIEQLSSL